MKRAAKILSILILSLILTGGSVSVFQASQKTETAEDIPVLPEETFSPETEVPVLLAQNPAPAESESKTDETEETAKQTESTKKKKSKADKEYKIYYKVIPSKVSKKLGKEVDWRGNPTVYTQKKKVYLKNPRLKGYLFKGWFSDKKGKNKVSRKIPKGSTGKRVFYALFEPITYTIRYDGNGLLDTPEDLVCTYGKTYKLAKSKNKLFLGWNTKYNGKGTAYKSGAKIKNLTAKNGTVITLYADGLTGRNNTEKLYRYFKRKGYSKKAAAAIAGNLMWESGGGYTDIKLNAVELATGRGVGMVQWTDTPGSPRRSNFIRYCRSQGYGWPNENLKLQIDFLELELSGAYGKVWGFARSFGYSSSYNRTLEQFKKCNNLKQAVGIFCACFERPYLRHAHLDVRVKYAKYVLNNYK